jgi:quercetin dioxygenase-like cupin family protein
VECWSLDKHTGVSAKLLGDDKNMTVLYTIWVLGAKAPEHIHPHEQMGLCLQGEAIFTIDGENHTVKAGQFYHIPGNVPHVERDDGAEPAILVDFFSRFAKTCCTGSMFCASSCLAENSAIFPMIG